MAESRVRLQQGIERKKRKKSNNSTRYLDHTRNHRGCVRGRGKHEAEVMEGRD